MHSPAHDDRCKDYVINAYVTWRGIFCGRLRPKLEIRHWCPRVRDWVLEARAQQARERSTGSLGTPDSIRLSGSAQSSNAKRDRQRHSQICREGVRLGKCAALQQPIDLATVVKYGGRSGLEMRVATVADARQNDCLRRCPVPSWRAQGITRSGARRRQHRIAVTTEPPSPRNESTMYSRENEPFIVRRAVKAVAIPAGV